MKRILALVLIAAAVAAAVLALPASGASTTVTVKDNVYSPRSLTVARGTRIVFVWRGHGLHNIVVTSAPKGHKFRSTTKRHGTYVATPHTPGTYRILCTVHAPDMRMVLHVR